jgi:CheY-like chemotaxis protein
MDGWRQRVLIVEDDATIRDLVVLLLEGEGYEVREAANGQVALDVLSEWRPDLILLDLMMPVLDGWTFLTLQRAAPDLRPIPVIVMSASRRLQVAADDLGAAITITKPFEIEAILAAVSSALGGSAVSASRSLPA